MRHSPVSSFLVLTTVDVASVVGSGSAHRHRHQESHTNFAINTHSQLEVAVHTTYDQYLASPGDKDIPFVMEGRERDKPLQVSLHEGVGGNV